MFTFGLLSSHLPYLIMAFFSCCLFLMPVQSPKIADNPSDGKSILIASQDVTVFQFQPGNDDYFFTKSFLKQDDQKPPVPDIGRVESLFLPPPAQMDAVHLSGHFCRPPPFVS